MFYRRQSPADTSQPNVNAQSSQGSIPPFQNASANATTEEWQLLLQMLFQQQQSLQVQMNQVCLALQQIQLTLGHVNNQLSAEKAQPNLSRGSDLGCSAFPTMAQEPGQSRQHQPLHQGNLSQEFRGAAGTSNDGAPSTPVSTPPSVVNNDPPRRSPSKGNRSIDDANVSRPSSLMQPWNPKQSSRPPSSLGSTPSGSRSGSLTNESGPSNPLVGRGASSSWQGTTTVPEVQAIGARSKAGAQPPPAVQRFSTADTSSATVEDSHRPRIIGREASGRDSREITAVDENPTSSGEIVNRTSSAMHTSEGSAAAGSSRPVVSNVPARFDHVSGTAPSMKTTHSSARPPPPRGVHDISLDSDGYGSYESKAYMKSIGLM